MRNHEPKRLAPLWRHGVVLVIVSLDELVFPAVLAGLVIVDFGDTRNEMAALLVDGAIALQLADETREYRVGRLEEADLPVADATVSRRHCSIAHDSALGTWRITDHDSVHGTLVNGVRLPANSRIELMDGARVQLGQSPVIYTFAAKPRPPKRPASDDMTAFPSKRAATGSVASPAPSAPSPPSAAAAPIGPERPSSLEPEESELPPDLTGVSELMTGTAVKWDLSKGWGFVKPDNGGPDVFAHKQQLHTQTFPKSLKPGEHVEFRLAYTDGRPKAVNITGPGGAFVIGQPAPAGDGGARQAEPGGVAQPGSGRGHGRGRGRSALSFHSIQLPGQAARGAGRGDGAQPRPAIPFIPRQAARKAGMPPASGVAKPPGSAAPPAPSEG